MMELFDSHCHVNEERFDEDREAVHERMLAAGVTGYMVVGSDTATSEKSIAYAQGRDGAYAAAGVHPHEAKGWAEDTAARLTDMLRADKVMALGEIGLDYYYDLSPRDVQQKVCEMQMELAWELGKPVIFHVRDAHGDMLDILKRHRSHLTPGVIHCFSGSAETAEEYLRLGYHISFAGPVTFKKAPKLCEAAERVPLERLLIETDSPYLSPEPMRGRRNEPAFVQYVCGKLAAIKGVTAEEMARITAENARRLYGIVK